MGGVALMRSTVLRDCQSTTPGGADGRAGMIARALTAGTVVPFGSNLAR